MSDNGVSWPKCKLKNILGEPLVNGRSVPTRDDGFPVLRLTSIKSRLIDLSECKGGDWTESQAKPFLVREGDFLISRGNGSADLVARGAVVPKVDADVAFPDTMIRIRVDADIVLTQYLALVWESPEVRDQIKKAARTTSGIYKVNQKSIGEIEIPVPPLEEQRRIAHVLGRSETLRVKRREAIALLDHLAQSVFLEMFGDPVSNQKAWTQQRLCDLGTVVTGNTPPRAQAENYGDVIEWIKSDNISHGEAFLTEASERLSLEGVSKARLAKPGSLLVTCIAGSPSSIGNVAITDREVAFNQQINSFSPSDGNSLFYYFLLRLAKPLILEKSTGGMTGLVSKSRFGSVSLIDPRLR